MIPKTNAMAGIKKQNWRGKKGLTDRHNKIKRTEETDY